MNSLHDLLQLKGASSLTDVELLALLMDDGAEGSLARAEALLQACGGSLLGVGRSELARLRMTAGVGLKRAARLVVSAELGRRMLAQDAAIAVRSVTTSEDVVRMFRPRLLDLAHEECWAISDRPIGSSIR